MSSLTFTKDGKFWESSIMRGKVCVVQIKFSKDDCYGNKTYILSSLDGDVYDVHDSFVANEAIVTRTVADTFAGMYLKVRTTCPPLSGTYLTKSSSGSGSAGSDIILDELTITANGTYRADTGHAYSKVTANVPTGATVTFSSSDGTLDFSGVDLIVEP